MPLRILLLRHGRSAHVHRGWIDRAGLERWNAAYDAAALHESDVPPASLSRQAREAGCVVGSDLPRAIASAERLLGPGASFETSPLLREAPLRIPSLPNVRLPLGGWGLAIGLGMLARRLGGVAPPPAVTVRARDAAAWLDDLARTRGTVVAVTHATFRAHLSMALAARGWARRGRRGFHHWSAWEYER